jgi:STE24 endopeptidase
MLLIFVWIIDKAGDGFVFWLMVGYIAFKLVLGTIGRLFIMPRFNKFEPIEENKLKTDLE